MPGTRRLVLLRHAEAARPPATPDHERDLTPDGEAEAGAAGRVLQSLGVQPGLVITSPSVRTRRTWSLAAVAGRFSVPVVDERRLYNASSEEILQVVATLDDALRTVVVCGHNPGLSDLAALLSAGSPEAVAAAHLARGMRTGDVAAFSVAGPWSATGPATVTLEWVQPPR